MRIAILTSVDTRHRYFANALGARCDLVAVAYEETGYQPAAIDDSELTPEERNVVQSHYLERQKQEGLFFGHDSAFRKDGRGCAVRRLSPGTLNNDETLAWLEAAAPDAVVVYGTNLIKSPLLGRWPGKMINLHLGLSPYYRGTATNFYPLVNGAPQFVGATIHLIDAGIDSGPIFAQVRPEIVIGDRPHTIGCKTILVGIETMIAVLDRIDRAEIAPTPQWKAANSRLYLRKHYHPRQVVELYRRLDAGLIADYVPRAAELCAAAPLVEIPRRPPEPVQGTHATAAR